MQVMKWMGRLLLLWMIPLGVFAEEAVVNFEQLPNVREAGEQVYSAGQPSAQQLQELAGQGLAAVINLRAVGEDAGFDEPALLQQAGVAYYHIPVSGGADLTPENAERLHGLLAQHAGQPVLVHCASGNRVGALLAVRAHRLQGQDAEQALATGRQAGMTRLEGAVRELLHAE